MTFLEKLKLIERVDQLLKMKATGTCKELSSRLNLSRSTTFELFETMRDMGAEIEYCSLRKTYFYTIEKVLAIGFVNKHELK